MKYLQNVETQFQSTRSARSATQVESGHPSPQLFQFTRSARSATVRPSFIHLLNIFQSTRSARSATKEAQHDKTGTAISIHALRKERDSCGVDFLIPIEISIHALRKERDSRC